MGCEPLRVGIVNYLNSRPLAWSFLRGQAGPRVEARFLPPARVADELAAGDLDVGLIPSIEYQRIPGLIVFPDLCVAATREVRSVLLVLRGNAAEIERLAVDQNSRTSVALARIVLLERFGIEPELVTAAPDLERMLGQADAALIIGDPALEVDRDEHVVLDLAAEWRRLTGHPFVFAFWAGREELDLEPHVELFRLSLQRGLDDMETLVAEAAAELGLDEPRLNEYLTECLSFELGRVELKGLEEFYQRAHLHGLIPPPRPLRYVSSCGREGDSIE